MFSRGVTLQQTPASTSGRGVVSIVSTRYRVLTSIPAGTTGRRHRRRALRYESIARAGVDPLRSGDGTGAGSAGVGGGGSGSGSSTSTLVSASSPAAASPAAATAAAGAAANAGPKPPRVVQYVNLGPEEFRHPLDQQNTSLLRALPGLEAVAKGVMGPVAEQVLLLENISTSVLVGPDQLPRVNALLREAAEMLQLEAPDLYVRQNPVPNAYTLAIAGRKPFIVVHTALLEILTPAELQGVIAHELGHLKCDHGVWLTAANVLASGAVGLLPVVSSAVEEALLRWLRAAELTCDRAALLVAQDPRVVMSALMKLAGGSPSTAGELNVDAFLRQARSYDEATSSPLGWYLRNAQTRALSHPLPVMRAKEIDRWAQGPQYAALLARPGNVRAAGPTAVEAQALQQRAAA